MGENLATVSASLLSVAPSKRLLRLLIVFCLTMGLLLATSLRAAEPPLTQVRIASIEREPYSGENLPQLGFINEVVQRAYQLVGVQAKIVIYPPGRARYLLETGQVDALTPMLATEAAGLQFSMPLPGPVPVLLKKSSRDLRLTQLQDPNSGPFYLSSLRDVSTLPSALKGTQLHRVYVNSELQQLDMLAHDRIDFALIDKYTAADLMANQRPQLIGKLDFISTGAGTSGYHLAFAATGARSQQAQQLFDTGLAQLQASGELRRISEKHGFYAQSQSPSGRTELVVGAANIHLVARLIEITKHYEIDHPEIEIRWRILDENTLRKRLLADFAVADGQFDLIMVGDYETRTWAKMGWLRAFDVLPDSYAVDDLLPAARSRLAQNGQVYGLPLESEVSTTVYRTDLFQQAGIEMPQHPSYSQLLQLAEAVHDPANGIYGLGLRGKPGWGQNMAFLSVLVNSFGGTWFDADWHPQLTSEAWKAALTYYVGALQQYGPPEPQTYGWQENQHLFGNGKLAIMVDASTELGWLYLPESSGVFDRIGFADMPSALTPQGAKWYWSWNLAVPKTSRHPEAAQVFAQWLTSPHGSKAIQTAGDGQPVPTGSRYSAYAGDFGNAEDFAQFVLAQLQQTTAADDSLSSTIGPQYVAIPEFPAIGHQVGLLVGAALAGELTVEQTLQQAQQRVTAIMIDAGYLPQ